MNELEASLRQLIRTVPHFPQPGVMFRDIAPLFHSPAAVRSVLEALVAGHREADPTHVGALDARGFLVGSLLAHALGKPLVLFRKRGKLPGLVLSETYATEYGEAQLEVHADCVGEGDRLLLVDDLIATGGTLLAAVALARRLGASVTHAAAIIDLPELGGSRRLREAGLAVQSLVSYRLDEA